MATFTDNDDRERPVTQVLIESGEKIALCRCFKSKKFPYCDGTHEEHPGTGPVVVESK